MKEDRNVSFEVLTAVRVTINRLLWCDTQQFFFFKLAVEVIFFK
jgi:hypothetical protein